MSENMFTEEYINQIESHFNLIAEIGEGGIAKEQLNISITKGPFAGCVIKYGKFRLLNDDNDQNNLRASFEYDIVDVPEHLKEATFTDEQGEDFENLIGDILLVLLYKTYMMQEEDNVYN